MELLLLNASNYPERPIYPYAFVQLGALARRAGLRFGARDLFGIPSQDHGAYVARLLSELRPEMVGLHVRQADSLVFSEYLRGGTYHPIEDTRQLIRSIRKVSNVPIVVGGFGFTTHAAQLFDYLEPDFAVRGEPDDFLSRFGAVMRGERLESVENLLFRRPGGVVEGPRASHGPLDEREYDADTIAELEAFYGRPQLYGEGAPSIAVELARGCAYRCYFCTEPAVKGRTVRERDLDVVTAELEFLIGRGLRRFWLVCSELNMGNARLAREVATRMLALRERTGADFLWHAYHLPRWFSRGDLELLYASGFAGGWNDFPSLDDENLRRCAVPYRSRHALEHLERTTSIHPAGPYGEPPTFSIFLGNAHATVETVRRSLQAYDGAGLAQCFARAQIATATRFFDGTAAASAPGSDNAITFRKDGDGAARGATDLVHPTFYAAPALLEALGDVAAIEELFQYVASTLLSGQYAASRDYRAFLLASAPAERLARWLIACPRPPINLAFSQLTEPVALHARAILLRARRARRASDVEALLKDLLSNDSPEHIAARQAAAWVLCECLCRPRPPQWRTLLESLGLRFDDRIVVTESRYQLVAKLLARFDDVASVERFVRETTGLAEDERALWMLRYLLYANNVELRRAWRPLLVESPEVLERAPTIAGFSTAPQPHQVAP